MDLLFPPCACTRQSFGRVTALSGLPYEVTTELPLIADNAILASTHHAVRNAALCWNRTSVQVD